MGKVQEVLERAQYALKIKTTRLLTDFAFNNLTIGKAQMFLENFTESEKYLTQAVDGLRKAGTQHYLPWGLLARAILYKHLKEFLKSWADLDEAREIAEYGQMRLFQTDYYLEAARVILAQVEIGNPNNQFAIIEDGLEKTVSKPEMERLFKEHVAQAGELIEQTGYHRRDGELEELRKTY